MERNVWPPEKTGVSSGPVQCRTPRTAPPTGKGRGRMGQGLPQVICLHPGHAGAEPVLAGLGIQVHVACKLF